MTSAINSSLTLHFAPLIPYPVIYGMMAAAVVMFLLSFFFYQGGRRKLFWRAAVTAGFLLIFLNPSIVEENRKPVSDVVTVVIDRSPSQKNGERTERSDKALADLKGQLEKLDGLEVRIISAPDETNGSVKETRLFEALNQSLSDVPLQRRAGVLFITDGQIHDIPEDPAQWTDYGPVHALLSGEKGERDRQLVILEAPPYGIVGQSVTIRYRIEDTKNIKEDFATMTSQTGHENPVTQLVPVGEDQSLTVSIKHAGQNIVDLKALKLANEITLANNQAPLIINGVRDRLRVLLVSGQPHIGGRTWRNILTADPSVDLVHFTILREPGKFDATPQNELSLIAFPFQELFETKLYDFDLIIFDRYRLNHILPRYYFTNIANYVKKGGAFLEASGPSFSTADSIYNTALKNVLPAYPTGEVFQQAFKPKITDLGARHPVTQGLHWINQKDKSSNWGSWLRQIAVHPLSGNVLMTGVQNQPLLILDRVGKGRVAQLASDQIWLWSRGFDGGGPQAEFLRRLAHWLMKEPELEENALDVKVSGQTITITRRSLKDIQLTATLTKPDGTKAPIKLLPTPEAKGALQAKIKENDRGIYSIDDGVQKRFAIIGDLNPPELRSVVTTESRIKPLVTTSKGSLRWLEDNNNVPELRLLPPGRDYNGSNWIGLRKNKAYTVTGVKDHPFFPSWIYALGLLALMIASWWFEGRSQTKK